MSQSFNDTQAVNAYGAPLTFNYGNTGPLATPDFTRALLQVLNLNANVIIGQPAVDPPAGNRVVLTLIQDGTGSRTVTWDTCYRDAPSLGSSGPAYSRASIEFWFDGLTYQYMGGSSTFAVANRTERPGTGGIALSPTTPNVTYTASITPTAGAVSLAGVASTVTNNAIVVGGPTVGALTLTGVGPTLATNVQTYQGNVSMVGQPVTRTP
jgi:hypothetical protein